MHSSDKILSLDGNCLCRWLIYIFYDLLIYLSMISHQLIFESHDMVLPISNINREPCSLLECCRESIISTAIKKMEYIIKIKAQKRRKFDTKSISIGSVLKKVSVYDKTLFYYTVLGMISIWCILLRYLQQLLTGLQIWTQVKQRKPVRAFQ